MKFSNGSNTLMRKAGEDFPKKSAHYCAEPGIAAVSAANSRTIPAGRCFRPRAASRGFTIIEIAICLGIIGFALVAIIAALPRGLDVQKRNREETIIGQDAGVWMNLLRSGARGDDDLTNYVLCISNVWTKFNANYRVVGSGSDYYTPSNSGVTSPIFSSTPSFLLTNGMRIVGLLSMPKLLSGPSGTALPSYAPPPDQNQSPPDTFVQSNYVIAYVRSFSGAAVENVPQTNSTILGDSFIYRMIVENYPYVPVDTNAFIMYGIATNGLTQAQMIDRANLQNTIWLLQRNAQDFRLRFRWPVLPNGQIPNYGALTFRSIASGPLWATNDPSAGAARQQIYFVQPAICYNQGLTNQP